MLKLRRPRIHHSCFEYLSAEMPTKQTDILIITVPYYIH